MKGRAISYSAAEMSFIRRRKTKPREELHAAFVEKFGRSDVSVANLGGLCKRMGWLTGPRLGRFKGRGLLYSNAEVSFIRRRRKKPRRKLHAEFIAQFGRDISFQRFVSLCKRNCIHTGRDGRFQKGSTPANKGKKRAFNANSARTQFKKGHRPHNTKWAGHERVGTHGYVEISIRQRNPHTGFERRYVLKHRWLWEQAHGPIPDDMVLKCKGNPHDTEPSN